MNEVEAESYLSPLLGRRFEGSLMPAKPFAEDSEGSASSWYGEAFEVEIEDESISGRASLRGFWGGRFGLRFWRGFFRGNLSGRDIGDVDAHFRFNVDIDSLPFGFGEGFLSWRGGESDFELAFNSRLKGPFGTRFSASVGRFGQESGRNASGETSLPSSILWLMQGTLEHLASKPSSELSIWIGPVSYDERDVTDEGTKRALAESLLSGKSLGVGGVSAIVSWLQTSAHLDPEARYFLEKAGLYRSPQPPYERGHEVNYRREDKEYLKKPSESKRLKDERKNWENRLKGLQAELAGKDADLAGVVPIFETTS